VSITGVSITGVQARMARAALRLSVRELARQVGIAPFTLQRIEADLATHAGTRRALRAFLEEQGIVFIDRSRGFGIEQSRSAECVRDVLMILSRAPHAHTSMANTDAAVAETIDDYLRGQRHWKTGWRVRDRTFYADDLVARLQAARRHAAPHVAQGLDRAIDHVVASVVTHRPNANTTAGSPQQPSSSGRCP
jgi:DNA-binding transcriptional regulator YhcF (GntR family)